MANTPRPRLKSGEIAQVARSRTLLTVPASPVQYLMLTAVSVHDQEHSMRIRL